MAILGKWTGGTVSTLPTTTWAVPSVNIFATQDRNDSSTYSLSSHVLTLPSSGLADGYLVVGAFEMEDTSNGRCNPQARFTYSGTGNFVSGYSSGFNRDNSEDRSYCRAFGFIDNPSSSATLTFQWRRDSDSPTGTTKRSELQIIPFYYADIGIYSSSSTSCPGNTTVSQVTGFTGTDGTNITISSNTVTVTGDNKRYLCLGSYYWQGIGSSRTQRWGGFRIDGTKDDAVKGYSYARNSANADIGEIFTTIIETTTPSRTVDMFVYRGDGVANGQGGANVAGNATGSNPNHVMVVLELNDDADVVASRSDTNTADLTSTAGTNMPINEQNDIIDTASFTQDGDTEINCVQTADYLFGANISMAANNVANTGRHTMYSEFTVNGTPNVDSFAGDYLRNNQGSQDTFGISCNLLGFEAMSAGDDIGVETFTLSGSESQGDPIAPAGWVGFWGLNLDTLEESSTMLGGRVPETAQAHVKRGSVGDNSVQDAVFGTSGILYTRLSTLASGCNNQMIDTVNGGTRGVTPVKLSDFRGYPMPEVDINWEHIEDVQLSGSTLETFDDLWVQPKLNYSVGFDVVLTIHVDQKKGLSLPTGGENRNTCTFTFNAGDTYPTGSTGTVDSTGTGSSKKWQINDMDPAVQNDRVSYSATASCDTDVYWDTTDGSSDTGTLSYLSQTVYTHAIGDYDSTVCGGNVTNWSYPCYSLSSNLGAGGSIEVFSDNLLTTHLSNGWYAENYIGLGNHDYFQIVNGFVFNHGTCTFP